MKGIVLDGGLATYHGTDDTFRFGHIGDPIPEALEQLGDWITAGEEIKLVTRRCDIRHAPDDLRAFNEAYKAWCVRWVADVPFTLEPITPARATELEIEVVGTDLSPNFFEE